MKKEFGDFESFLRGRGLKVTRTRALIFEEIFAAPTVHPNAEEIYRKLESKKKRVSLATIYRTLNLLVRSGLVSAVDLGEDHSHFEPEWDRTAHGHLICLSCGRVQEFGHQEFLAAIDRIGREKGFKLDKFSIQVFGFCRACGKK